MTGATTPYRDADQRKYLDSRLDARGFFLDPLAWSPHPAALVSRLDGLPELTPDHWQIIPALRDHYARFTAAPPAFRHIRACQRPGPHGVEHLFRSDREAWRMAGLSGPGEKVRSYLKCTGGWDGAGAGAVAVTECKHNEAIISVCCCGNPYRPAQERRHE